jgi:hypothetical protein
MAWVIHHNQQFCNPERCYADSETPLTPDRWALSLSLYQSRNHRSGVSQDILQFPYDPGSEAPQVTASEIVRIMASVVIIFSETIASRPDPKLPGQL